MSALAKEAAAFKSVLARQDYTSWHSQPPPPKTEETNDSEYQPSPAKKKKRQRTDIVYSQPADTGTGNNVNTQLIYVVDELKASHYPKRLEDLAIITNTPLLTDAILLQKFKAHDRVVWDPKTDLYSYKHDFTSRSKASLLTEIQRQTKKGGGIPVRALKESWKEAPAAIEELEKEGEVLVTRTAKDGALKMVFWNELKPSEEHGGKKVEKEFVDLWHELEVPNDVDLLRQLANEGLQLTTSNAPAISAAVNGKGKKKKGKPKQRQTRITNTHLKGEIDLSRDYEVGK